ncbi:AAA-like domain-containing protein, partial [Nostoc sp. LEGE 12450]|uniref:AAA-like domain-containing protein n=1 Tax=Nostoc sp. LEGE 12450 TaxID=1828643 RepID=UPI00188165A2
MVNSTIYTVGGTVQAGGGIYIPRQADEELLGLCRSAIFAYVLTPRQMGKSSLMVRTAQTLTEEGISSVIVDLQELGASVTAEQWYFGFLVKLDDQLMFDTDVVRWWQEHQHLGVSQRLTLFFERVLLAEVEEQVVIFVDEIDSTLSLNFTDDFYTAIRYLYVARATNPEFHRLSFVLMGVATPGDLIRDAKRTPFNIGQRVDLTDFTFEEALPLADGLGLSAQEAKQVLRWVLKWTGGHPYLSQRLCGALLAQKNVETPFIASVGSRDVDDIVSNTFFGVMSEQDNNLQFVRDMLTKRAPHGFEKEVLSVYRDIRRGKRKVVDEEQSLAKSHLKLSGAVRREGNALAVRNPIYRQVFDERWIWEHFPENLWQRLQPALPLIATLSGFSLAMAGLTWYAFDRTYEAEKQKENADIIAKALTTDSMQASDLNIEALIEGLKIGQQVKKLGKDVDPETRMRAIATLQKSFYSIREHNRLEGHSSYVYSVAFSLDGKTIASGSEDNTVRLWNLAGQELKTLKGHSSSVNSVAFSPDGKTIASGSSDNTVRLWNLAGQELKTLKGHSSSVLSVAFSPDGKTIASGSNDNTVRLWNLAGQELKTLKGHSSSVLSVAFSPDGKTIASGSKDNTARLWNLAGQELKTLKGHSSYVLSVAFSPDGKTIASGSGDNTVRLWNLAGQELKTLKGHSSYVLSVAFSPDGKTIASGSND